MLTYVRDVVHLPIVVPCTYAEQRSVLPEKRRGGVEVLEEVGSDLEVVLVVRGGEEDYFENDDLIVVVLDEHLVQEPSEVARELVVPTVAWTSLLGSQEKRISTWLW